MEKEKKLKIIHLLIIVLGIIFIFIPVFHNNLWFDESYSVAMSKHGFSEIWNITGNDVHPPLYYWILHILYLIFGSNVLIYRLVSVLFVAIMGILGFTHIRKDFGAKTGIIFSFLTLFLPFTTLYSGEIRMYSLGMLLGTILAIYGYRIYKGKVTKLTYIFFGLSSLLLAYTHYYGLMLAGIINLIVFIYLVKNVKTRKQDLIKFIITAVIQVILYMPWLIKFIKQATGVSNGFWITLSFPETIYDVLTIQFKGNLSFYPIILVTCLYAYIIYIASKSSKEEKKEAKISTYLYISIIAVALGISLVMQSAILLSRYLLIATGLLIFTIAFFMAKDTKKIPVIVICLVIVILSSISTIKAIKENYSKQNEDCLNYLQSKMQEGDIIVYTNAINGAVITTELSETMEFKSYFYDEENWNVEEAYKSYSPYMEIKKTLEDILNDYTGRIILIEGENTHKLKDETNEKFNIREIEEAEFKVPYRNYNYTIEIVEKF